LPDDYEDPSDLAAIQDAKSHMGDYKLKSASDYVVAQRVNTKITTEKVIMHKLYVSCLCTFFTIFTKDVNRSFSLQAVRGMRATFR